MNEPTTTMQWVVYDMQQRKAVQWHFTEAQAIEDARRLNPPQLSIKRFQAMSRAVLLRISQAGNQ